MGDEFKYSTEDDAVGAVNNNAQWLKVKLKNTIRYAALGVVLIAFYHLFAFFSGLPAVPVYVETVQPAWEALGIADYNYVSNIFVGAAAACVVWFMP